MTVNLVSKVRREFELPELWPHEKPVLRALAVPWTKVSFPEMPIYLQGVPQAAPKGMNLSRLPGPARPTQVHLQRRAACLSGSHLSPHCRIASCIKPSATVQESIAFNFIVAAGRLGKSEFH